MDTVIQENGSSFADITIGGGSTISNMNESLNATSASSEPEESITTVLGNYHETQIDEFCAQCMKKGRKEAAATHFCKQCSRFGKYICQNCLRSHNEWSGHKKMYSLSEWKRKEEKNKTSATVLKGKGVKTQKDIDEWLEKHRSIVTKPERPVETTLTSEDDETNFNSLSLSAANGDSSTLTGHTMQTPPEDYSYSMPTHDSRSVGREFSGNGDSSTLRGRTMQTPSEDYSYSMPTIDSRSVGREFSGGEINNSQWILQPAPPTSQQNRENSQTRPNAGYDILISNNLSRGYAELNRSDRNVQSYYNDRRRYSQNQNYEDFGYEVLQYSSRSQYQSHMNCRMDNYSVVPKYNPIFEESDTSTREKKTDRRCSIL